MQPTLHTHSLTAISAATHHIHYHSNCIIKFAVFWSLSYILCSFVIVYAHSHTTLFMHTHFRATYTPSLTCTQFYAPTPMDQFSLTSLWCGLGTSVLLLMPSGENKYCLCFEICIHLCYHSVTNYYAVMHTWDYSCSPIMLSIRLVG